MGVANAKTLTMAEKVYQPRHKKDSYSNYTREIKIMSHKRKIVVFIKIMLIIVAFLIYRYWVTSKKASVDDINDLVPISLNGIITSIKYQSHGFYYIGIFVWSGLWKAATFKCVG